LETWLKTGKGTTRSTEGEVLEREQIFNLKLVASFSFSVGFSFRIWLDQVRLTMLGEEDGADRSTKFLYRISCWLKKRT
jgi:hypothetical protein